MVFKRSRCCDGDGDGDDGDDGDGVRGLCQERLRQLRWARALKMYVEQIYQFIFQLVYNYVRCLLTE